MSTTKRSPGKPAITAEEAVSQAREAGLEPEEPYPGRTNFVWKLRCVDCGQPRRMTLAEIRHGRRCRHRGAMKEGPRRPTLEERGAVKIAQAVLEAEAAGYEVLEKPSGYAHDPMNLRCIECRRPRKTSLTTIRSGDTCKHVQASAWC